MTKDEIHNHIKSVAEYYVSKSWNTFLDLDTTDLIMAGIGVGKIIAGEQEKRIEELEQQIEKMKCCGNCDWSNYLPNGNCLGCDGKKNWKLREIKR